MVGSEKRGKMEYLSVTETAKLVRQVLANQFPNTQFSVRSKKYSGGASIDIHWTDGPAEAEVEPFVKQFEGADFDGMIDLKTYNSHYLLEDGSAVIAHAPGTTASAGSIPEIDNRLPIKGMKEVHFGADFIFCSRTRSNFDELHKQVTAIIRQRCHCEGKPPNDRFGNDWVEQLANSVVNSQCQNETLEAAFERRVLRRC
jgi:hypothetical protein